MSLALLYICTGKYRPFFEGFYRSCETNFLPGEDKTYFVWTDDDTLGDGLYNVRIYHRDCEGFPADSLFRFEMFLQAEDELKKYDYIYFLNANAEVRHAVGNEILPDETGLAMGRWPGRRERQHYMFYPYERNKQSLAYIPPFRPPYIYFMGGLNGGTSSEYLKMIRVLAYNIRVDYNNGIIAKVHDESHINAYLRTHKCKVLPTTINQPEEYATPEAKIVFREKTQIDGYFSKGRNTSFLARFKKSCSILWDVVRWYLSPQSTALPGVTPSLLCLLKIAMRGEYVASYDAVIRGTDWDALYKMSSAYSLNAFCFKAISMLPKTVAPDYHTIVRFAGQYSYIEKRNDMINNETVAMCRVFERDGWRCTVLKGQSVAQFYDSPMMRAPGDIDLWVEGEREDIIQYVRNLVPNINSDISLKHINISLVSGTQVEVHFVPSLLASPRANARLQSFYHKEADEQFANEVMLPGDVGTIKAATARFDAVHVLVHIFEHVFYEGLGLRQYMDYYYVLQHLETCDKNDVVAVLRATGLYRFAGAVMYVLREVFGLTDDKMLAEPDSTLGKRLLNDVFQGQYVKEMISGETDKNKSALTRFVEHSRRQWTFFRLCPAEVLWSPLRRISHYLWRKEKGFFKK